MHCNTSKRMQQEFEPKLPRDIFKMLWKKSFYFRARFGAIYGDCQTKKYLLKNTTIGNRLLFSELANTEFTRPENLNWCLLLPDSNLFLKFQNNFTFEIWATFSYGLLPQRFFWNSSGIFIISTSNSWHNSCPRSVYCRSIAFLLVV